MTKLERRHLRKFQRVCAAAGLPKPTARNLCECAILVPSRTLPFGKFFGDNACKFNDVVSKAVSSLFAKHGEGNDIWTLELFENEETGGTEIFIWYFSFIVDGDGVVSVATFALDEGGRTNELLRKDWEYVQRF